MPRVVRFDLNVKDAARARQFYTSVFDWQFEKWDGPMDYWLIRTGPDSEPGINGGMIEASPTPPPPTIISVPSVDDYCARIIQAGGRVVVPKMAIPGVGYMAHGHDTEGLLFGILQSDPTAA